jgi:hypothetical protein
VKDTMFSMVASIFDNCASTCELSILKPITSQCSTYVAW